MGIFDPKVNVELTPERTVDVPQVSNVGGMEAATTLAQGASDFVGTLFKGLSRPSSNRSSSSTAATRQQQGRAQFLKDYQDVQQIKDDGMRLRKQRQLLINASAAGVDIDWMNSVHHTATGQDVDLRFANKAEQDEHEFVNNPANAGYFLTAKGILPPDATSDEITQQAMVVAAQETQLESLRKRRELVAEVAIPDAVHQMRSQSNNMFLGKLREKIETGEALTETDIVLARQGINELNAKILSQNGLSDVKPADRQAYTDAYEVQLALLDTYSAFTASNVAKRDVLEITAAVTQAIRDADISSAAKLPLLKELTEGGLQTLLEQGIVSAVDLTEKLPKIAAAIDLNGIKIDTRKMTQAATDQGQAAGVEKEVTDPVQQEIVNKDKTPTSTVERLDALTTTLEGNILSKADTSIKEQKLLEQLVIFGEGLIKLGDKDGQWFSAKQTTKNNYVVVRAIREAAKTNPLAAATAAKRMAEATGKMALQSNLAHQSSRREGFFKKQGDEWVVDMEALVSSLDLNSIDQQKLETAANKYYDGSIADLIADRGSRTPPVGTTGLRDGLFLTLGDKVANEEKLRVLKDQQDATVALEQSSNMYLELAAELGLPTVSGLPEDFKGGVEVTPETLVAAPVSEDGSVLPLTPGDAAPEGLPPKSFQAPETGTTEAPAEEATVTPEQAIAPTESASEGQQAITQATTQAAPTSRADITKAARAQAAEEGYQEGTPAFTARSSALQRDMLAQQNPELNDRQVGALSQMMSYAPEGQQAVLGMLEGQKMADPAVGDYVPPSDVASDTAFVSAVGDMGRRNGWDPSLLMAIMDFETGGSFSPSQKNLAGSSATGLIQFMSSTAKGLGTTTAKLAKMTRLEQLVYVEKYLKPLLSGVKNPTLSDMYMAVLWPKAVGKPNDYVLFRKGTKQYGPNAGLDTNKDGTVTKAEASSKVYARLQQRAA